MRFNIQAGNSDISIDLPNIGLVAIQEMALRFATEALQADEKACESKPSYVVHFKDHGEKKIECIKVMRNLFGIGLKEAKEMSERPYVNIYETKDVGDANRVRDELSRAGAHVETLLK